MALLATLFAMVACNDGRTFDHYKAVALEGWERNDTAIFSINKQKKGTYSMELGLRATQNYPYKTITLIVERTIIHPKTKKKQTQDNYQDTITCRIIDNNGRLVGKRGIANTELMNHVSSFTLQENDSLNIAVRHIMSRDMLPGISDVGIRLTHN